MSSPCANSVGAGTSSVGAGNTCSVVAPKRCTGSAGTTVGCAGAAGATQSPSQKEVTVNSIGSAGTVPDIIATHKRQMLVVSYESVSLMHGNVPRARNCDVKVVELMKGPDHSIDLN